MRNTTCRAGAHTLDGPDTVPADWYDIDGDHIIDGVLDIRPARDIVGAIFADCAACEESAWQAVELRSCAGPVDVVTYLSFVAYVAMGAEGVITLIDLDSSPRVSNIPVPFGSVVATISDPSRSPGDVWRLIAAMSPDGRGDVLVSAYEILEADLLVCGSVSWNVHEIGFG